MPTLRYKTGSQVPFFADTLNPTAIAEVLTGDDSAFFRDLEVLIAGEWKCLSQAFKDRDVITDNYNLSFREEKNDEERKRGYYE